MNPDQRAAYLKGQVVANLVINAVVNGLIAYFSYRQRDLVPLLEIAVDAQITVAIIGFLVAWIGVAAARKQARAVPRRAWKWLPARAAARALILMLGMMLAFGGLGVTGLLALAAPGGMTGWAYFLVKTAYTGVCAACTSFLAVRSVFSEWEGHAEPAVKRIENKELP